MTEIFEFDANPDTPDEPVVSELADRCPYCAKVFKRIGTKETHSCRQMERHQLANSMIGMRAYGLYQEWMRCKTGKADISMATFAKSKLLHSFCRLVEYFDRLRVSYQFGYIKVMVGHKIDPHLWTHKNAYRLYIDWIDQSEPPLQQVSRSVEFLFKLSEQHRVPVQHLFNILHPQQIIEYIQTRHLSPWLLFASSAFTTAMMRMDGLNKEMLLDVLGDDYWLQKFQHHKSTVADMRQIAVAIGI